MRRLALLLAGDLRRATGKTSEARLAVHRSIESGALPPDVEAELRRARTALDEALDELRGARRPEKLRLQGP